MSIQSSSNYNDNFRQKVAEQKLQNSLQHQIISKLEQEKQSKLSKKIINSDQYSESEHINIQMPVSQPNNYQQQIQQQLLQNQQDEMDNSLQEQQLHEKLLQENFDKRIDLIQKEQFKKQLAEKRQTFCEMRKPKNQNIKQEIVNNYQIKEGITYQSDLSKKLEQTLKKTLQWQNTNEVYCKDHQKINYKCYPCLKQKPKQPHHNQQTEHDIQNKSELNYTDFMFNQLDKPSNYNKTYKENVQQEQQQKRNIDNDKPQKNKNENVLINTLMQFAQDTEQNQNQIHNNFVQILENEFMNEEHTKLFNEKIQTFQQILSISLRKFRNKICQNNLFLIDQKIFLVNLQNDKCVPQIEKINEIIQQNEQSLKNLEIETIKHISEECLSIQFDNNTRLEMFSEIERYKQALEISQKSQEQHKKRGNDYALQINRLLERNPEKSRDGLKNTIQKLIELENELNRWQTQYGGLEDKNQILQKENSMLNQENKILGYLIQNNQRENIQILIKNSNNDKYYQQEDLLEQFFNILERDLADSRLNSLKLSEEIYVLNEELEPKRKEILILRKNNQELIQLNEDFQRKIQAQDIEAEYFKQQLENDYEVKIKSLERENNINQVTIQNLEQQLIEKHQNIQQKLNKATIEGALKELALIILTKDRSQYLDDDTKSLIKQLFGENYSNIVENYEAKLQNLNTIISESESQINQQLGGIQALKQNISLLNQIYQEILKPMQSFKNNKLINFDQMQQDSQLYKLFEVLNQILGKIKQKYENKQNELQQILQDSQAEQFVQIQVKQSKHQINKLHQQNQQQIEDDEDNDINFQQETPREILVKAESQDQIENYKVLNLKYQRIYDENVKLTQELNLIKNNQESLEQKDNLKQKIKSLEENLNQEKLEKQHLHSSLFNNFDQTVLLMMQAMTIEEVMENENEQQQDDEDDNNNCEEEQTQSNGTFQNEQQILSQNQQQTTQKNPEKHSQQQQYNYKQPYSNNNQFYQIEEKDEEQLEDDDDYLQNKQQSNNKDSNNKPNKQSVEEDEEQKTETVAQPLYNQSYQNQNNYDQENQGSLESENDDDDSFTKDERDQIFRRTNDIDDIYDQDSLQIKNQKDQNNYIKDLFK